MSAVTAAEAAGMSRVTLQRVERGEPSVTMGAYVNAAAVLGLDIGLVDATYLAPTADDTGSGTAMPARIQLRDHPQLAKLAWQYQGTTDVSAAEALNLYERNWRHVDQNTLGPREREPIRTLAAHLGGGRLLV